MSRNTAVIERLGVISERNARDVAVWDKLTASQEDSLTAKLGVCAGVLSDSLKYHLQTLKWYQFRLKKIQKKYFEKPEAIIRDFSVREIINAYEELMILEGVPIKKKDETQESRSAEKSQTS